MRGGRRESPLTFTNASLLLLTPFTVLYTIMFKLALTAVIAFCFLCGMLSSSFHQPFVCLLFVYYVVWCACTYIYLHIYYK